MPCSQTVRSSVYTFQSNLHIQQNPCQNPCFLTEMGELLNLYGSTTDHEYQNNLEQKKNNIAIPDFKCYEEIIVKSLLLV